MNIKGIKMIARIWHGRTKKEDYQEYAEFLKRVAMPDYKNTAGFKRLIFLKNIKDNAAHFTLITFWENLDVIRNFAGEYYEKAKYYPEDKKYLLEFEENVTHYDVFAEE
jgi:heme-degrading monooxygenase HmoA